MDRSCVATVRQERAGHRLLGRARTGDLRSPVCDLLGGAAERAFPLYVAIPLGDPDEMREHVEPLREQGIRHFQLKLGGVPDQDAARACRGADATEDGGAGARRCQRQAGVARRRHRPAADGGPSALPPRAAVPDDRGVPASAQAHPAADDPRRGDHRPAGAAASVEGRMRWRASTSRSTASAG